MKMTSYRKVLLRQPPQDLFGPFVLTPQVEGVDGLKRLQGLVSQACSVVSGMVWYSTQMHPRVSLPSRGQWGGSDNKGREQQM